VTIADSAGPIAKTVALAQSDHNLTAVHRHALDRPLAARDAYAVRGELAKILGLLTGEPVDGKRIDVAGLIAFRYEIDRLETPKDGRSTIVALFDGATEYLINCQSLPHGRAQLQRGCKRAIDTLQRTAG
jgi:hypothetical protein